MHKPHFYIASIAHGCCGVWASGTCASKRQDTNVWQDIRRHSDLHKCEKASEGLYTWFNRVFWPSVGEPNYVSLILVAQLCWPNLGPTRLCQWVQESYACVSTLTKVSGASKENLLGIIHFTTYIHEEHTIHSIPVATERDSCAAPVLSFCLKKKKPSSFSETWIRHWLLFRARPVDHRNRSKYCIGRKNHLVIN